MEPNLRDLLDLAVGEPPRWVNLEAVRRQAVRRRVTQAGFASLVIVVAAALTAGLSAGTFRTGSPAAGDSHLPADPPRYYVIAVGQKPLQVRATATGKVTGTVPQLKGMNCNENFAATENETFYLLCERWKTTPAAAAGHRGPGAKPPKKVTVDTLVYRFGLSSTGAVTGFALVKGTEMKGALGDLIGVAPDGSQIAVEVTRPPKTGPFYTNTVTAGIFVISTKTGHRAFWHTGPYVHGALQYAYGDNLSFTGDGKTLVVQESRCLRTLHQINCNGHAEEQVRAYSPAAGGGSLEQGQVLVNRESLNNAVITPDGSALVEELVSCPRHGTCTLTVQRLPLSNRKPVILYQTRSGTHFEGIFDRFFSADPTGRFVILDAGTGNARVNGWINKGHLVPLTPSDGNAPDYEAW